MSVSSELLCSFELLKPLDTNALKSHIKKGRNKRQSMLNSPVSADFSKLRKKRPLGGLGCVRLTSHSYTACQRPTPERTIIMLDVSRGMAVRRPEQFPARRLQEGRTAGSREVRYAIRRRRVSRPGPRRSSPDSTTLDWGQLCAE